MKHATHGLLTLLLLIVVIGSGHLCAQTLYNNDTTYFCSSPSGGGFTHNYVRLLQAFDSWGVITGVDSSCVLDIAYTCFRGSEPGENYGYIDIWDGDDVTGTLLVDHFTGANLTIQSLPITQEQVTIHVHYNAYSTDTIYPLVRELSFSWRPSDYLHPLPSSNPCTSSFNIGVQNVTTSSADIHWTPDSTTLLISVNGQYYTANGGTLHLSGLAPNTHYHVKAIPYNQQEYPCCCRRIDFYTIPQAHIGCPDVLNLYSDYVRCFCNNSIGIQDYGPSLAFSRHTVHTNPNEIDSIAGGLLHTVCPGMPGSVRLGNWRSGAENESIVYYLHIDTTLYSLILLHYAAVLQNPNHAPSLQPRFKMRILDQNDSVIDEQCGAADFIADSSLGWNVDVAEVLWKDWTTVGINLAQYHGQDVRLQFSTYDCLEGAHFGYAYFYAECQQPSAIADQCGTVDTVTLTAPDGFNYLWYSDSPSNPISTDQQATFSTEGSTVHCRLSFIENPTCYVTMNTYVTHFWPHAVVDTLYTVDNGCDGYTVQFLNRSTILGDDSLALPGNPPCETAQWSFGDGFFSHEYSPTHIYRHPGTYTVTLVSGLAEDQCTDTTTYTIVAPDAWAPGAQHLTCCDSLLWLDSIWYSRDTIGPTARVHFYRCDTIYTLHLSILPSAHFSLPADTFCYNSSYTWRGNSAPINHSSTDTLFPILTDTLTAANGCDSVVYLPLVQLPPDDISIKTEPDCGMGYYMLTATTDNPFWQWSSSPYDSALDGHEADRHLWVFPESNTTYTLVSYYGDSLFCPTSTSRTLSRPSFPHAKMNVNPNILTADRQEITAYDLSEEYSSRRWGLVTFGRGDTIHLPDTLRRITYRVPIELDSIKVILTVIDRLCLDTATQTISILQTNLFVPNIFTPTADANNRFIIVCEGALEAELTIYNRQGLFVYSTTDIATGWDGTHDGSPCPQGAYVWHLRLRTADRPDSWTTQIGTVTLLR